MTNKNMIIAEIGSTHDGSIYLAKKSIDMRIGMWSHINNLIQANG